MSSKNFYGLTGDVTIDGGILNVANTNVSGNVTSTSLLVSNVATLGTTKTFVVRASGGAYYIDEDPHKSLELHEGQTYIFDLSHSSLASGPHPLEFATQPEGANSSGYTTGISATGTLGTTGAKKTFVVSAGAPTTLYYYCTQHSGMGGQINISPAAELVVSGRIVASGNVEASKITASANVEVTGNVVASKFVGDGSLLTSVTAATTSGLQVVTDNSPTTTNTIEFTNPTTSLRASSNIVATGNVTADHFIGDGSQLSGIVTSLTLEEVVNTDNTTSNTVQFTNTSTSLTASGNVEVAGNVVASGNVEAAYFIGDGSQLSGIVTSVTLEDAVNAANTTSNTVQFTNTSTSLTASGNVEVTGNVIAGYFIGDGSRLTNLPGGSGGSGTSHWTKDAVTSQLHYNAGSVGVSNTNPAQAHDLSVGSNLYVDDDATDGVLMVTGNVHGTYFVGDGSRLVNLPEGGGSTNWTTSGNPVNKIYYPQNPGTTSVSVGIMNAAPTHTLSVGSNLFVDDAGSDVLVVDGNITAESMFLGALGIRPSYPLDTVTDAGNVTPHTISFTNPTLGITTASNVEIGGALTVGKGTLGGSNLEVGEANLFVNTQLTRVGIATDQPEATLHVNGSLAVDGPLTFGTVNVAAQHGLEAITAVSNTTPLTVELQNVDTSLVTTGNVEVGGDLTVTGNVTTNSDLTVAGNVFYKKNQAMTINVDSNVVTEYTGPHDRPPAKYPEIILPRSAVGAEYNGYRIDRSSEHVVSGSYDGVHDLFNETAVNNLDTWGAGWQGTSGAYSTSTGEHSTYVTGGTTQGTGARLASNVPNGEWVSLKTPNAIKLDNIKIRSRNANDWYEQFPTDFQIWGSNDGTTWFHVKTFTGQAAAARSTLHTYIVNSAIFYNRHALVVTKIPGTASTIVVSTGHAHFSISELRFNANEEGGGSLDTTLKNVYNVPVTTGTQLEVYYDGRETSSYTGSGTTVTDLAGTQQNGTFNGGFDPTYKAFTFNGTSQNMTTTLANSGTPSAYVHTFAFWTKPISNLTNATQQAFLQLGTHSANSCSALRIEESTGLFRWFFHSNDIWFSASHIIFGEWNHIVAAYDGGSEITSRRIWVNGHEIHHLGSQTPGALSLSANAPLSIGSQNGGSSSFNGSIANFRLYSKALNADQVKELYDYQKDYFLGSKSQVTLYKGHLGVGVTEPSGQLELAGDERIQEYPPRALTNHSTYIEGHGVFKAYASRTNYNPWSAFDGTTNVWYSDSESEYNGNYSGSTRLAPETVKGEYLILEMPYEIVIKHTKFWQQMGGSHVWDRGVYYAKRKSSDEWTAIHNVTDRPLNNDTPYVAYITDPHPYKYFAIVPTRRYTAHATNGVSIRNFQIFGTPGPTTLDKGSLTLGRSLDVPRISRYDVDTETPRPEKLVVHFDTTVNSTPTDISGKGNHGRFVNDATYSAPDKAFKFAAANAHIYLEQTALSGTSATHTFSLWINALSAPGNGNYEAIFEGGVRSGNQAFGAYVYQDGSNTRLFYHVYGNNLPSNTSGYIINTNNWYHICGTLDNSGNVRRFYVNGELFASDTYGSLNVTHPRIRIGENVDGSEAWHGMVSNFKLYNVALEPSEIRKLYKLGRTGRSMVISDTAVGIGRAPEAQLDVRGIGKFETCHIRDGEISGTHGMLDISKGVRTTNGQLPPSHTPPLYVTGNFNSDNNGVEFRHSNQSQGIGFGFNTIYATGYASAHVPGQGNQDLNLKSLGSGSVRSNGSVVQTSDDRIKTNEEYITNATETLLKLKPQVYDKHQKINEICENPIREAGLITQDVYYDAPELRLLVQARNEGLDATIPVNIPEEKPFVDDDPSKDPDYSGWGTDVASLNYIGFIPYLIKSNQEIYNELQAEKTKNSQEVAKLREQLLNENIAMRGKITNLERKTTDQELELIQLKRRLNKLDSK